MYYQYPFANADERLKLAVWIKGKPIPNYDPAIWRWDVCGKVMCFSQHGNTNSEFGWEIDHIIPRSRGGPTVLENLQPLNWKTNRHKADDLQWSCPA